MSTLKTDNIVNVAGNGPPTLTNGVNVTGSVAATTVTASGVITGSSFAGSGANLTGISSEPFKPVSLAGATYVVTVASVDSVNKFHIAGVSNPTLNFSKANVYIFDLSDSSNAGHPLVFKTSGSVAYTTGVVVTGTAGQAGAKVTITVAASAPLALLYSCSAHGNAMGNTIAVAAAGALDVGTFNFFDQGSLTANTTVSFASVPTNARWQYSYKNTNIAQWDISQAVFVKAIGSPTTTNQDFTFKPDGTQVYIVSGSNPTITQMTLSTPWDITTATSTSSKNISAGGAGVFALDISTDGLYVYITAITPDTVEQYTLSTPWLISTATLTRTFSVASQDGSPLGLVFKPDGLKMYIVGNDGDDVNEYNLSTAWNISTAVYSQAFSLASQTTAPIGLHFRKTDGLKMYIADDQNQAVLEYTLSTGWDISTATYVRSKSTSSQTAAIKSVFFSPVGEDMYVIGQDGSNTKIHQFLLADYYTLSLPSSVVTPPTTPQNLKRVTYDFFTLDGGTTVDLISQEIV